MRFFLLGILGIFLGSCESRDGVSKPGNEEEKAPLRVDVQRPLMGTLFSVTVMARDYDSAEAAIEEALDLAEEFGERATDYDPESELNRLTTGPVGQPVELSSNLYEVLKLACKISEETGGIYDPTLGPLTHLWRAMRKGGERPDEGEIEEARMRCGVEHLRFDDKARTVTVLKEGMQLDLGGIAKGFAADLIFESLRDAGFPCCLVAAAGDLRMGDAPPGTNGWSIGLRTFRLTATKIIELENCAVSTSGDLHQRVTLGDEIFSHIIDPRTGLGLTQRRAASVVMSEAKFTDPLATAACLTPEPRNLIKGREEASMRVLYEDAEMKPVLTGIFSE